MTMKGPPTIEIYPMMNHPNGDATMYEGRDTEPEFYDVVVRYLDDEDDSDPVEEFEDIKTYEEAIAIADRLQLKYPDAEIEDFS
jgi:hypothetical protein